MSEIGRYVEGMVLGAVVTTMLIYFSVFLLATWAERPEVGRYDDGRPRPVRDVR